MAVEQKVSASCKGQVQVALASLMGCVTDGLGFLDRFSCFRLVSVKSHAQLPEQFLPMGVDG